MLTQDGDGALSELGCGERMWSIMYDTLAKDYPEGVPMNTVRLEELTRGELNATARLSTVVVPLGSLEQHGPSLPICVDAMLVTELAMRAAHLAAPRALIYVAPTVPYGFSHHHLPFGATISISNETYVGFLTDIGMSLHASGFRRIVFLNGHGGNASALVQTADRLAYEHKLDVEIACLSYWDVAQGSLEDLGIGPVPGHAGNYETSCVLALRKELVRTNAADTKRAAPVSADRVVADPPGITIRRPHLWTGSDGRSDGAEEADSAMGAEALDRISGRLAEFLVSFVDTALDSDHE